MKNRMSRLVRDVLGRNDDVFVSLLCSQVDAALEAARILRQAVAEDGVPGNTAERLAEVENDGDQYRSDLIHELSQALTTPIDREDLFRLSRSIDDVLDNLRDFASEYALFDAGHLTWYDPLLEALVDGLSALRTAVASLSSSSDDVSVSARDAKHANRLHQVYAEALAELFRGEVDMEVFKHRELLRRMDIVGVRLEEAADVLADASLKRH